MTLAAFLASLSGRADALAQIAGWKAAERTDPRPMSREEWAELARAEAEIARGRR